MNSAAGRAYLLDPEIDTVRGDLREMPCFDMARRAGDTTVKSHRPSETGRAPIADFAMATNRKQMKTRSLGPSKPARRT